MYVPGRSLDVFQMPYLRKGVSPHTKYGLPPQHPKPEHIARTTQRNSQPQAPARKSIFPYPTSQPTPAEAEKPASKDPTLGHPCWVELSSGGRTSIKETYRKVPAASATHTAPAVSSSPSFSIKSPSKIPIGVIAEKATTNPVSCFPVTPLCMSDAPRAYAAKPCRGGGHAGKGWQRGGGGGYDCWLGPRNQNLRHAAPPREPWKRTDGVFIT